MTTRSRAEDDGSSDVRGAHSDAASADSVSADLVGILDTVDLPIVAVGRDFTVARFNRGAAAALGLTPSDIGRSPRDIQVLTNVLDIEELCAQVITDGAPCRREVRDGDRWFLLRIAPYTRSDRQIGGALLTFTNVTAFRASIVQAIYEREYTKAILNTVIEPLVVLDAELRVQTANRAFYVMFQVSREETQGVPLHDLGNHDWDTPRLWTLLKETLSDNREFQTLEVEYDFPAIGSRTVLLDARRLSPEGHPGHMILLAFRDITERKEAETARVRLAAIVESSDDAIISKNLDSIITSWNHGAERLFGYTAQEAIGQPVTMLMPSERLDEESGILERIRRGESIEPYETFCRRKDGALLDISSTVSPITDAQGRIVGASRIARDISARKQAEEVRSRLAAIIDSSDDAIVSKTLEGLITSWNRGAERMFGYTAAEALGQPISLIIPAEQRAQANDVLARLRRGEKVDHFETVRQAKDGRKIDISLTVSPVRNAEGRIIGASKVARDITARKQAEEALQDFNTALTQQVATRTAEAEVRTQELAQANAALREEIATRQQAEVQLRQQQEALFQREKLAAMGTLLASVAHELNNPLSIILLQAELLRQDTGTGPLAEYAADITQAATRCERLVRQFLTLARQHGPERATVDLNALVTTTMELLVPSLRVDNIALDLRLAGDLPRLWADPHHLQQVVVNLVTNAQQALREVAAPRYLTLTTRYDPASTQVTLGVADTGLGIPAAIQGRIFEPFFTTKPPGVGTGLGLSLCRAIIEDHGGSLRCTSQPGQGTTFWIELPVGVVPEATPASSHEGDSLPAVSNLAILIVDDEPIIANGMARLLRRDGYTVDTAANGRLALAKLQERRYDLILSDQRMPELDGPGLYRALEQHYPQLHRRFIFLTGDILNPDSQAFCAEHRVPQLAKPYTAAELRRVIQQVLQAG